MEVVVDGRVDRQAVGSRVFSDRAELEWLESLVHPLVREEISSWVEGVGGGVAVVEVPLLFESELHDRFDATIAIVAEESIRQERAGARDQAGLEGREARQLSQAEKAAKADHVVVNDGTVEDLEMALLEVLDRLGVEVPPPPG
jgi:dephospho-CoA kinase